MPMYSWRSEALKQYSSGWVVAHAETVDEARSKALEAFKAWLPEHRSWFFLLDYEGVPLHD